MNSELETQFAAKQPPQPQAKPFPAKPFPSQPAQERPIFIFGCPRSGTSLLSRIIDCHPRIAIPFESHLYNTFHPWLKYYGDLAVPRNRERLVKDILQTEVMRDWTPPPDFARTIAAIEQYDFPGIVAALMQTWTTTQGKHRWGEKTPAHLFYWHTILQDFPNLQVIHILRDGRDVALSWKRARFGPKHMYLLAQKWKQHLEVIEAFQAALSQDAFLEIRYEDLISKPEQTVQAICTFLGEDFAPEMLAFHEVRASYPTDQQNQQNLSRPLLAENVSKWRTEISPWELQIFEAVAGEKLTKYGYECALTNPRLSSLDILRFKYLEHPPKKLWAMLQNRKGHIDGLRRLMIYLRLRLGL
jgi:hypothetical protein